MEAWKVYGELARVTVRDVFIGGIAAGAPGDT
jgi:hypothetical protein